MERMESADGSSSTIGTGHLRKQSPKFLDASDRSDSGGGLTLSTKLLDASDRSDSGVLSTSTRNMTSTADVTSLRQMTEPSMRLDEISPRRSGSYPAEEKEEIMYGEGESDVENNMHPQEGQPQEGDFKPASIGPSKLKLPARGPGEKPLSASLESMELCDVFKPETDLPPVNKPASLNPPDINQFSSSSGGRRSAQGRNHHSSSTNNSDESSILLDVSWGSNNFDKALIMSSFDDMLAVKDGHKIGGGRFSSVPRHVSPGSGSNPSGQTHSIASGGSSVTHSQHTPNLDVSSRISGSFRSIDQKLSNVNHLQTTEEEGDPNKAGMIPPVFKTLRRNSREGAKEQQVVRVDGGGDGERISKSLGFKENSKKKGSMMKRHARRRMTNESDSSRSGGSFGRLRRASNASQNSQSSENMTGFQVLRASVAAARGATRHQSMPNLGNGGENNASLMGDSSREDPSRAGYPQGSPSRRGVEHGGKTIQLENTQSIRGIDVGHQVIQVQHLPMEYDRANSNSTMGPDFSGRDGVNCSSRDDSDGLANSTANLAGGPGAVKRKDSDEMDTELVAEVGGTAYLRASRKVWGMRIIVVITFILVAVIVTVLTYTFFRSMETTVLNDNFMEISTMLVAHTTKSLDNKASSTMTLSKTYTSILGAQKEMPATGKMDANQPPSIMLSSSAMSCSDDGNWKTNWPNVTLPGHDEIGSALLGSSSSRATVFAPLLWEDEGQWEAYATDHALLSARDVVSNGIRSSDSYHQVQQDHHQHSDTHPEGHEHGRGLQEGHHELFSDTSSLSTLRIPAWQVAPAELMNEGAMWDYYSHPAYKAPIDRILSWNKELHDMNGMHEEGVHHDHGRLMTTHEEYAAQMGGPPIASTELIHCSETLLPLHLNPPLTADRIQLEGIEPLVQTHPDHDHRSLSPEDVGDDYCSAIFYPVYDAIPSSPGAGHVTGVIAEMFSWTDLMADVMYGTVLFHEVRAVVNSKYRLPDGSERTTIATYLVSHDGATFLGQGRITEDRHEAMMEQYSFSFPRDDAITYVLEVYPTDELCYDTGVSNKPMFLSIIAACFFFLSVFVFFVYDYFVNYRQKVVVRSAARSARIVHSLYPQFVRDNLFKTDSARKKQKGKGEAGAEATGTNSTREYDEEAPQTMSASLPANEMAPEPSRKRGLKSKVSDFVDTPATQLKRFLAHPMPSREYDYGLCTEIAEIDPIAEVFENTTVMLADIEGFTAWCSEREPSQVFRLLETVYREFDIEARKLGVFKVETVGDCYVAVTGLPDPRDDHAIVIAKYAVRCLLKFNVLTKRLEANLGPGTASLGMRFGLHSGPVTAGVLRGEKSRFQLFGDTINVASRMESTGEKNMIQVSQDTADLLNASGKGHWLTPREGPVSAKGKGAIHTYWLQPNRRRPSMHGSLRQSHDVSSIESSEGSTNVPTASLGRALRQSWVCIGIDNDSFVAKERLIRWNAAILESFLLKIVDNRNAHCPAEDVLDQFLPSEGDKILSFSEKLSEKIMFPDVAYRDDYYGVSTDCAISSEAQIELLEYVARIASLYRDVPFHNFDHASHVTMSANKLLNRVCTTFEDEEEDVASVSARTFGISADPLAQFVVVFSSLVHDVDHQGVPNAQLVKENDPLATQFDNRSVAEKRSIMIAWDILMEDRFRQLQSLIFVNGDEMKRFKQLLINTVLATDIADKERSAVRKTRWQKAFHPSLTLNNLDDSVTSRFDDVSLRSLKATLVFEQIMQASDVAHTMQHWETFKKWNKKLYSELSKGYREGRGASDPRENWYGGEIGFFDFYIIPLAQKLKECGVFGSAASEYLDYALENRRRWEEEGEDIASKMVQENDAEVAKMVHEKEVEEALDQHPGAQNEAIVDAPEESAATPDVDPGEIV